MQAGGTWIMMKRTYGVDHGADKPMNDGQFVSSAHLNSLRVGLVRIGRISNELPDH